MPAWNDGYNCSGGMHAWCTVLAFESLSPKCQRLLPLCLLLFENCSLHIHPPVVQCCAMPVEAFLWSSLLSVVHHPGTWRTDLLCSPPTQYKPKWQTLDTTHFQCAPQTRPPPVSICHTWTYSGVFWLLWDSSVWFVVTSSKLRWTAGL